MRGVSCCDAMQHHIGHRSATLFQCDVQGVPRCAAPLVQCDPLLNQAGMSTMHCVCGVGGLADAELTYGLTVPLPLRRAGRHRGAASSHTVLSGPAYDLQVTFSPHGKAHRIGTYDKAGRQLLSPETVCAFLSFQSRACCWDGLGLSANRSWSSRTSTQPL